jgi:hypothetical protein
VVRPRHHHRAVPAGGRVGGAAARGRCLVGRVRFWTLL